MSTLEPVSPPPVPAAARSGAAPLSPQHLLELRQANDRAKRIRRAVKVATINGWTIGTFGALSTLFCAVSAALDSTSAMAWTVSIGMVIVAVVEFKGAGWFRRLDGKACARLGLNQLLFAALLTAYAIYSLAAQPSRSATELSQLAELRSLDPQMADLFESLSQTIHLAVYVSLIAVAVLVQGGNGWYYFSRRKHIESYVRGTPNWIIELQKTGVQLP